MGLFSPFVAIGGYQPYNAWAHGKALSLFVQVFLSYFSMAGIGMSCSGNCGLRVIERAAHVAEQADHLP